MFALLFSSPSASRVRMLLTVSDLLIPPPPLPASHLLYSLFTFIPTCLLGFPVRPSPLPFVAVLQGGGGKGRSDSSRRAQSAAGTAGSAFVSLSGESPADEEPSRYMCVRATI